MLACLITLSLLSSVRPVSAEDLVADFSSEANPNGSWSYGYAANLGGTITLFPTFGNTGSVQGWYDAGAVELGVPTVWESAGGLRFHPGSFARNKYCIIRFTANANGAYDVTASLQKASSGSVTVHVLRNGVSLLSEIDNGEFDEPVALQAGDVIDLAVGPGNDGFFSDSTNISATITLQTVPGIASPTSSGITGSSATLGGTVMSQGASAITGRGVVFSLASSNPSPAIGGPGVTRLVTTGTTGAFAVTASGLSPATTYAFRAYATNADGTSYTPVATFSTPPYVLTTSAINGTIQSNPNLSTYAAGSVVTLTAVGTEGAVFQGWTGDLSGTTNPTTITMDANKTVTAVFVPSLAGALDTSGLTYTLGGNINWFPQTTTTHDGADAVQSGAIGHSQQSWFETTVTGPGNLSYWWKVSSESGWDFLEFYIDGTLQTGRISGNVDWTQKSHLIPTGSHVLRWRYAKDGSADEGSDSAWVDQLVWVPQGGSHTFAAAAAAAGLTGDNALPNAIPFNDGVQNLLKYAFNMNLAGPDVRTMAAGGSAGLPSIRQVGTGAEGILRFEYVRRIGSGLVYTPKKSTTLTAVDWTDLTDTPTIVPIDANWERVIYEEPIDPTVVPKCFGRIEVAIPAP